MDGWIMGMGALRVFHFISLHLYYQDYELRRQKTELVDEWWMVALLADIITSPLAHNGNIGVGIHDLV